MGCFFSLDLPEDPRLKKEAFNGHEPAAARTTSVPVGLHHSNGGGAVGLHLHSSSTDPVRTKQVQFKDEAAEVNTNGRVYAAVSPVPVGDRQQKRINRMQREKTLHLRRLEKLVAAEKYSDDHYSDTDRTSVTSSLSKATSRAPSVVNGGMAVFRPQPIVEQGLADVNDRTKDCGKVEGVSDNHGDVSLDIPEPFPRPRSRTNSGKLFHNRVGQRS